jgi:hypothetical protein
MIVRLKQNNNVKGTSNSFNTLTVGEVLVHFDDGSMTSMYISDLDVLITRELKWIPLSEAFKQKLVITDNYNTHFFEPKDKEEKIRGYRI